MGFLFKSLDKEFTDRIEYELNFFFRKYREADKTQVEAAKRDLFDYIEDTEKLCADKGKKYSDWFVLQVSMRMRAKK